MHQELERLIDLALADGKITDKELEVLYRKAKELAVDMDEFEMVLEGKLHLAQEATTSTKPMNASRTTTSTSQKEGDARKCPSCGAVAKSFATVCAECGHEYRNTTSDSTVSQLFQLLQQVDVEERNRPQPQGSLAMFLAVGREGLDLANAIANRQAIVISNFPVPNSKEAIVEFLALALPQTKVKLQKLLFTTAPIDRPKEVIKNAWTGKCQQIIMKARFSMKGDKETLNEIEQYARELQIK